MLTGVAAHTILPLPSIAAAGAGLALTSYAHGEGWPIPIGGSQAIVDALIADLEAHGGELVTDHEVRSLDELPSARAIMLDVTPRALLALAGDRLPARYRRALSRFRYGNAVAKVDFALSDPVPWTHPELSGAGTLHLGGTRQEIAASENAVARGRLSDSPYVLVSQPSLFDDSRAPAGKHTLWAYTHVPAGSRTDRLEVIIRQIERFAPGFRDTILASSSRNAYTGRAPQPELRRGRHRRRRAEPPADAETADARTRALAHSSARRLSGDRIRQPRPRCPRARGLARCAERSSARIRDGGTAGSLAALKAARPAQRT